MDFSLCNSISAFLPGAVRLGSGALDDFRTPQCLPDVCIFVLAVFTLSLALSVGIFPVSLPNSAPVANTVLPLSDNVYFDRLITHLFNCDAVRSA